MPRKSPLLSPGQVRAEPEAVRDAIRILETQPKDPEFTVAELSAIPDGALEQGMRAYCTDESGGAVPVFFDGADWRRVTDRAVIT